MHRRIIPLLALSLTLGAGCAPAAPEPERSAAVPAAPEVPERRSPMAVPPLPGVLPERDRIGKQIHIVTPKGDIVFALYGDEAPLAASNFVWLAGHGFYDGLTFHRVEPGFMIQGGDPLGNGRGGPGYAFKDEPVKRDYDEGIVAMANSGPDTNGSQFFIMLADNPGLSKDYTIFGKVLSGMDVVKGIRVGDVMTTVTIEEKK